MTSEVIDRNTGWTARWHLVCRMRRQPEDPEEAMFDIRTALRLDALASGGLGLLLAALAGVLDGPLGLPVALSVTVGLGLVAWAGFVAWVSTTGHPRLVREVIVLNIVWVLASLVYAIAARDQLSGLGTTFVVAQAAAVAGLTEIQVLATRRTPEPVAA